MVLSTQSSKTLYSGNGTNQTFPVAYPFFENTDIEVWLRDETDPLVITELLLTEGALQDYEIVGTSPSANVVTTAVLTSTQKLLIRRILPITQDVAYNITDSFPADDTEEAHDRGRMIDQQLLEVLSRSILQRVTSPYPTPEFPEPEEDFLIGWSEDTPPVLINIDPAKFAGSGQVGIPTDGIIGVFGSVTGILPTDTIADAFDKVDSFLGSLAPIPPPDLSTLSLTMSGLYTTLEALTGATIPNCTDVTQPLASVANFSDGNAGTLSAVVDGATNGSITVTTADDTGASNGDLTITDDSDPYAGVSGSSGFFKQLSAQIMATVALALGQHTYKMSHSTTGDTPVLTFVVDDPGTVALSNKTTGTTGTSHYVSGVPGLAQGQPVNCSMDVSNAVRTHYNATQVGRFSSPETNTVNVNPGSPPANGDVLTLTGAPTVSAAAYSENVPMTFTGFNSKGGSTASTVNTGIRVDTVSNEVRKLSGQGQYPTQGAGAANFGGTFDSTVDLNTSGNEELQMLDGLYQYPNGDYTAKVPVGPDYTAVPDGTFSNYRWVTMDLGAVSAVVNTTLTFNGAQNFGGSTIISGLIIEVRVIGSTPTAGWIDGNANYPGVGIPTNNGDPALNNASSSTTVKVVTFGSAPKTGNVWVRVGIPTGSSKKFTGITRS